jgi:glycosyltransferase involved in cell wall biosynthesis
VTLLAVIALICAALPCALFLRNIRLYTKPPRNGTVPLPAISVLIPARDEERNIEQALRSVLANDGIDFEVIVLDDHSSDNTAGIVTAVAASDTRVRLEPCPPLPAGWCGKQHACAVLARMARHPVLLFMDADVRLEPDALRRCTEFLLASNAALVSGVPRQVLGSCWEKMLLPLIQFVLLGFLPMDRMRRSKHPSYAAGCGQLFIARADAYHAVGGHGQIRSSLHDGIKLPRAFRAKGFHTDLFDATEVAQCRMYQNGRDVFSGLAKNATEGLAAPARILPVTLLFLCGQVLPLLLLFMPGLPPVTRAIAGAALLTALLPRVLAVRRFKHPAWPVLTHPFAIVALLGIQWFALARTLFGRPAQWRGRAYAGGAAALLILASPLLSGAQPGEVVQLKSFTLADQHERTRDFSFPRTNASLIVVADWKGSEQLEAWIKPIHERYGSRIGIDGIADVSAVPAGLRGTVRRAFVKQLDYAVMLDWSGAVARQFLPQKNTANVFAISRNGRVLLRLTGKADAGKLATLHRVLEKEL